MCGRFCLGVLLFAGLLLPLVSCSNQGLTSIVISPTTFTTTLVTAGAQGYTQFKAIGYYGHAGSQSTQDITSEVKWLSNAPQVATICNNTDPAPCIPGLATASGSWTGVTDITASAPGFNGDIVSNDATFTVTAAP